MQFPLTVPPTATALRPSWMELPEAVRSRIEQELAARVRHGATQGSGFTPGFASRLELTDGSRWFVKAASDSHPWLLEAYRAEAEKVVLLPASVSAPALRWQFDGQIDGRRWLILAFDDIDGRPPHRPWQGPEAVAALESVAAMSAALTPAPSGWDWSTLAAQFGASNQEWEAVREQQLLPHHTDEAAALAQTGLELCLGSTLVHSDLRDDNLILDTTGAVWVCDWNFPVVGPSWVDTVTLLIGMHGDGLDAEALLARSPLVRPEDSLAISGFLAILLGYFLIACRRPDNGTSPYLRAHQSWYADVTADWLGQRLGWSPS